MNKFEPQLDGFQVRFSSHTDLAHIQFVNFNFFIQLQGSTLRVEADAKVRPLANMNYKNAEDKVKVSFLKL